MRLRFAPYAACVGRPHVVVDGAPQAGTTLTLSHWPGTPTPPALAADTSAEIVLRFLELPERERTSLLGAAGAVTNNHFDEDGALALFALLEPQVALARRRLLVAAAEAGDFLVWHEPAALKVALAVSAAGEAAARGGDDSAGDPVAAGYEAVLPRIGAWLADPDLPDARGLWEAGLAEAERGVAAFETGRARIVDRPDLDLAVVERDAGEPVSRLALYPRTPRSRIVWVGAGAVEGASLRYETWVRLASRRPRPRADLRPLVPALDRLEVDSTPGGQVAVRWVAEAVDSITPELFPVGPDGRRRSSRIPPARFLEALASRLAVADGAGGDFDPYGGGTGAA